MVDNWKKKTALFFVGQLVTMIGSMLVQYAIIWHIAQEYNSGVIVMLSAICAFLPQVLISFFAGVWADRYSRKMLIILADGGIAIATLALAILFIFGHQYIWLLLLISAIRSVGQGIQSPAVNAFVADIVPQEKLMKVNGLMGMLQGITMVIPIALGGIMYAIWPMHLIFFIDVGTAIIGISFLIFLKTNKRTAPEVSTKPSYFTDFKQGMKYVFANKFLRVFFIVFAIISFIITPVAFLSPLQTERAFDGAAWRLAAVELSFAVGMIIMGFVIGFWQGSKSKTKTMGFTSIIQGILMACLGVVPLLLPQTETGFILYMATMLALGCAMPYVNTPAITILQESTDPAMMGRVFGVVQVVQALALPIGMSLFGPLADIVKIEWLMIGTGIAMLLLSIAYFKNHAIKNYKDYAYKPKEEEITEVK